MPLSPKPYLQKVAFRPGAEIDFESYPYNIPSVRNLGELSFHADVTFFVGENGAGKSTVLEAIAMALGYSPEGGTKNVRLETTNSVSALHHNLRLSRSFEKPTDGYFLRAESFFNVATYMDQMNYLASYGGKSLHSRSHGEAFMTLLTHKFRGKGLYLMDEPEAALSPTRQLAALAAIHRLVLAKSQFIIATHSPILLSYPNARILQFDGSGITEVKYEDTEHYTVTHDFLSNYKRMLDRLFAEG
ncbi:MAG: family ATPase [Verrucomicrobiaceae bacterium]|nr:family ATPase [Verrucomicrobiaceae bacterium]